MKEITCYPKNIMIVDNNPDIVKSLQDLLESQGFQVITANNSRNCLLELEKGFQGIIILDLTISDMDNVTMIKKNEDRRIYRSKCDHYALFRTYSWRGI